MGLYGYRKRFKETALEKIEKLFSLQQISDTNWNIRNKRPRILIW